MNDLLQLTDEQLVEYGAMLDDRMSQDKKELDAIKEILRSRGEGKYLGKHSLATVGSPYDQWSVDKKAIFKAFGPKRGQVDMDEWFKQYSTPKVVSARVSFKFIPDFKLSSGDKKVAA
jgi:hypothetical protein